MDIKYHHEKILIIVALTLCTGILFYNAFFIPQISIPSVIYIENDVNSSDESDADVITEDKKADSLEPEGSQQNDSKTEPEASQKVNINTATVEEIAEKLSGIGPAIAKRIVEYRNTNGSFSFIEEIKNVSGIGEKIFEQIKYNICV